MSIFFCTDYGGPTLRPASSAPNSIAASYYFRLAALPGGDLLVANAGARLARLAAATGRVVWERRPAGSQHGTPLVLEAEPPRTLIAWPQGGGLDLLDAEDGSTLFEGPRLAFRSRPLYEDFDGDGVRELFALSASGLAGLWRVGRDRGAWSLELMAERDLRVPVDADPVAADLDGDGIPEVLLGSWSAQVAALALREGRLVYAWPPTPAFPIDDPKQGNAIMSPPAVFRDGNEVRIAAVDHQTGLLKVFDAGGKPLAWRRAGNEPFRQLLAAGDLDGDGEPEALLSSGHKLARIALGVAPRDEVLAPGYRGPCPRAGTARRAPLRPEAAGVIAIPLEPGPGVLCEVRFPAFIVEQSRGSRLFWRGGPSWPLEPTPAAALPIRREGLAFFEPGVSALRLEFPVPLTATGRARLALEAGAAGVYGYGRLAPLTIVLNGEVLVDGWDLSPLPVDPRGFQGVWDLDDRLRPGEDNTLELRYGDRAKSLLLLQRMVIETE